ncbi:hypothetical protein PG985_015974 [Apiospora marii]|uniref:uncharacterized protein n=1 Tax=Apiospora marii TaxID=335849 RepID=UPI00312DBD08
MTSPHGPITDPTSPRPVTTTDPPRDAARSADISSNTFGDGARIHYGDIHVKTGQEWLHRAYQNEPRRCRKVLEGCHCNQPSAQDDFLLGFANTRTFHTWHRRSHHLPLWIQKGANSDDQRHKHLALCVLKQAIRAGVAEDGRIFMFSYRSDTEIVLPKAYSIEKSKIPHQELSSRYSVEILLLSIFMQAKAKGLELELHDIDTRPEFLVDSLTSMLASALRKLEGTAYILLDELFEGEGEEHGMSERLIKTVVTFLIIATHDRLLTPAGLECLTSLEVSRADDRRAQIADPAPGSVSWIWDHPALQDLRDSQSGALASIGKPGSGKSVLGKTIVQELGKRWAQAKQSSSPLLLGEWFYCQRLGSTFTAYMMLLKFVLWKFLISDSSLFSYCKSAYRRDPPTSLRTWTEKELEGILERIIEGSVPLIMVFDAIDESNGDRMVSLIAPLVGKPRSRTKAIFLSRPMEVFDSIFWKSRHFKLQDENSGGIQKIVEYNIAHLKNIMYGSGPKNVGDPVIRTHADLRQAQSKRHPQTPKDNHKNAAFQSLKDIMHGKMFTDAGSSSARTPESRCAPQQLFEGREYGEMPGLDTVEQRIIKRAGDFDDISEDSVIQLMHQTVNDFPTSSSQAGEFSLDEDKAFENVLQVSANFVKLALPGPLAPMPSTDPDTKVLWSSFIAKAVSYLDNFRLLSFCFHLLGSNACISEQQTDLILSALFPDQLMNSKGGHIDELELFGKLIDDRPDIVKERPNGPPPSVLGFMFFFTIETGLKHGALNYLMFINLRKDLNPGHDPKMFADAMLFGAVMTLEFHHHPYQYIVQHLSRVHQEKTGTT